MLQRMSSENPLLLIETPVGGAKRGPTWNMEVPQVAPDLRKRLAASCPTTPNTAFLKVARPHAVARAGLIQSARGPAGSAQKSADIRRNARRQLFAQAADLAADLARLRQRIQDRLQQLPAYSDSELSNFQGCSVANSGAISLSSHCSQAMEFSVTAPPDAMPSCDLGSTMGMLHTTVSESGRTPCGRLDLESDAEASEELSMPQSVAVARSVSPDLESMPPRIQRIAQVSVLPYIYLIHSIICLARSLILIGTS